MPDKNLLEVLELLEQGGRMGVFEYCFATDCGTWSEGQAALYGVPRPEHGMPWRQWVQMLVPEDYERFAASYERAVAERREQFDYSFRIRRPEGNRWIGGFAKIRYDAGGRPLRLVGINQDTNDKKRAQQQARETEQRKSQLMASIADELDHPLAAIRSALEVARKQAPVSAGTAWAVESIAAQAALLARLADDLHWAADGAGRSPKIAMEPFSLELAIDMAFQTAMPSLKQRGRRVSVCSSSDVLVVKGDAVRLAHALSNLLLCSAKLGGAALRVASFAEAGEAVVSIQAEGAECTNPACTMALELARSIVAGHGGTVEWREGDAPDERELIVRLPLLHARARSGAASPDKAYRPAASIRRASEK